MVSPEESAGHGQGHTVQMRRSFKRDRVSAKFLDTRDQVICRAVDESPQSARESALDVPVDLTALERKSLPCRYASARHFLHTGGQHRVAEAQPTRSGFDPATERDEGSRNRWTPEQLDLQDITLNTFWGKDPFAQSCIMVTHLPVSPSLSARRRPTSAPARPSSASTQREVEEKSAALNLRRQRTSYYGAENYEQTKTATNQLPEADRLSYTNQHDREERSARDRKALILRLREVERENSHLRAKIRRRGGIERMQHLDSVRQRNLAVIASLQKAKISAERTAKRAQDRVRILQSGKWAPSPTHPVSTGQDPPKSASMNVGSNQESADGYRLRLTTLTGSKIKPASGNYRMDEVTENTSEFAKAVALTAPIPTRAPMAKGPSPQPDSRTITEESTAPPEEMSTRNPDSHVQIVRPQSAPAGRSTSRGGPKDSPQSPWGRSIVYRPSTSQEAFRLKVEGNERSEEVAGKGELNDQEKQTETARVSSGRSRDFAPKRLLAREREALRRREEREALRQTEEQEELRLSSSFLATELPATSGPNWATIKAHQELVRKQRIRERAAHVAATSSLPARMAQHAAMLAIAEGRRCPKMGRGTGEGAYQAWEVEENAATKFLRKPEPEEIARMTLRRQKRWEQSLAAAKAASKVSITRPRTPPMEKRRLMQASQRQLRNEARMEARAAAERESREKEQHRLEKLIVWQGGERTTVSGTRSSMKKADETRRKLEQEKMAEKEKRVAAMAKEARRREVGRAMKAFLEESEARWREEHGAGVPLVELIMRKKEQKEAEFKERWELNKEGLRKALRKRPNLMERQEKYAREHSRKAFAEAMSARDFLESSEGFAAAGRRAAGGATNAWKSRARTDGTFGTHEKAKMGLIDPDVLSSASVEDAVDTGARQHENVQLTASSSTDEPLPNTDRVVRTHSDSANTDARDDNGSASKEGVGDIGNDTIDGEGGPDSKDDHARLNTTRVANEHVLSAALADEPTVNRIAVDGVK